MTRWDPGEDEARDVVNGFQAPNLSGKVLEEVAGGQSAVRVDAAVEVAAEENPAVKFFRIKIFLKRIQQNERTC